MLLKGAMRGGHAAKRWCWAEEGHGEPHEACIALRAKEPLAYLVGDASPSSPQWLARRKRRGQSHALHGHGPPGKPVLPCRQTGEPQSADGAARNTPSPSCRLRLLYRTREAFQGMRRGVDRKQGETLEETPMPLESGGGGVGVGVRERRTHGDYSPWRRPLALGVLAHEVAPRACASGLCQ